jgi:hypothetical protein
MELFQSCLDVEASAGILPGRFSSRAKRALALKSSDRQNKFHHLSQAGGPIPSDALFNAALPLGSPS